MVTINTKIPIAIDPDGSEYRKNRCKFRCPKYNRKQGFFCKMLCSLTQKLVVYLFEFLYW